MPKTHRTKPEHGAQTRSRLLTVARRMFGADGYTGVSLREVCDRAGVTRGALYHHFLDKESIFRAVCEEIAADVTQQVVAAAAGEPGAWERLNVGCQAFLDACAEPEVARILLSDAPAVLGWDGLRKIDARHGLGLLRVGLEQAMDEGTVERGPVDALAHVLVGALNEAAMTVGRDRDAGQSRRDAGLGIQRMLVGIAGTRAPRN
jgi:AcrR family transcriptional regulator